MYLKRAIQRFTQHTLQDFSIHLRQNRSRFFCGIFSLFQQQYDIRL